MPSRHHLSSRSLNYHNQDRHIITEQCERGELGAASPVRISRGDLGLSFSISWRGRLISLALRRPGHTTTREANPVKMSRLLILVALLSLAFAKESSVRHLTSKDFDEVVSDGKVYFVK